MSLGEKAMLKITSDYGYGARGAGGVIPPNADLNFEVELLGINGKSEFCILFGRNKGFVCISQLFNLFHMIMCSPLIAIVYICFRFT